MTDPFSLFRPARRASGARHGATVELLACSPGPAAGTTAAAAEFCVTPLSPRSDILPDNQRAVWKGPGFSREDFTLYGGTALAVRRASIFWLAGVRGGAIG